MSISELGTPATAILTIDSGEAPRARIAIDADSMVIGRRPECDIVLPDITVSTAHARLVRSGGLLRILDLGSLNGTYVDRERVHEAALHDGAEIQIGRFRMRLALSADE